MQKNVFTPRKTAVMLCLLLLLLAQQQVYAGPVPSQARGQSDSGPVPSQARGQSGSAHSGQPLRRTARMTPLWRIMNSKPLGAYCQNNYECSTGLCRVGHCSNGARSSVPAKY